ncbi:MAG: hypothetical protein QM820_61890 [Minicystis sp.]
MTQPADGYTFRHFHPEDAESITRCALRVHGESYPRSEIYSPATLRHLNATGAWISMVAVDARGDVAAHLALEPSAFGPTAELGVGLVFPEHRRHALTERLRDFALAESARRGFGGQYSEISTTNVPAQTMAARNPGRPTALTLGLWPADGQHRTSFVRIFRYVKRPPQIAAHVPPQHADILARIYAELEVPLSLGQAAQPAGPSRIAVETHPRWQATFITIPEVGAGTFADLNRAHQDFITHPDLLCATLELPLAEPGTAAVCAHAERLGFFFTGVTPYGARTGDALRLQCLKVEVDRAEMEIVDPFARELLDYVTRARKA